MADVIWQYYRKDDNCKVQKPTDPGCICWHDEGTGPYSTLTHSRSGIFVDQLTWREKPGSVEVAAVEPQKPSPGKAVEGVYMSDHPAVTVQGSLQSCIRSMQRHMEKDAHTHDWLDQLEMLKDIYHLVYFTPEEDLKMRWRPDMSSLTCVHHSKIIPGNSHTLAILLNRPIDDRPIQLTCQDVVAVANPGIRNGAKVQSMLRQMYEISIRNDFSFEYSPNSMSVYMCSSPLIENYSVRVILTPSGLFDFKKGIRL